MRIFLLLILLLLLSGGLSAQVPPDTSLTVNWLQLSVQDQPGDDGSALLVNWSATPPSEFGPLHGLVIERSLAPKSGTLARWDTVTVAKVPQGSHADRRLECDSEYLYRITAVGDSTFARSKSFSGTPLANWFNPARFNMLAAILLVVGLILYAIFRAKKHGRTYIRPLAGLEAIDEAVGRATEMGRKILFVPGINDMDDVQTIAGLTILGRVAQTVANYDTPLAVPVSKSMVMVVAREVLKEAYVKAGRPDAYNENMVQYITDDQFGYAAGLDGIMVRERPATIFYMGTFYAESLILAETGHHVGAIQIAGTAMTSQLPFFITACDYTLIGEELYAASAYLSKDPMQLGSLKGQDFGKLLAMGLILLGVILETAGIAVHQWFKVQ